MAKAVVLQMYFRAWLCDVFLLFHRLLAITLMFSLHSVRVHYDVQKAMCLRMNGQVKVAILLNLNTLLAST